MTKCRKTRMVRLDAPLPDGGCVADLVYRQRASLGSTRLRYNSGKPTRIRSPFLSTRLTLSKTSTPIAS